MAAPTTRNGSARVKSSTATKVTICDKNLFALTDGIYVTADWIRDHCGEIFDNATLVSGEKR
jgi:hypothetical protein